MQSYQFIKVQDGCLFPEYLTNWTHGHHGAIRCEVVYKCKVFVERLSLRQIVYFLQKLKTFSTLNKESERMNFYAEQVISCSSGYLFKIIAVSIGGDDFKQVRSRNPRLIS